MKLAASSHKLIKPAAGIVTAVVALTTTVNVSAQKWNPNAKLTWKAATAVSRILGPDLTRQIFQPFAPPGSTVDGQILGAGLPPQGIALTGPFNTSTFSGIGILVANHVAKMFKVPYYSYASPFINAMGVGLLVGGVVGGFLDPDPAQISNPAPVNYPAITSTSPPVQMSMTQTASGGLQF